jgi:hypothetical protein
LGGAEAQKLSTGGLRARVFSLYKCYRMLSPRKNDVSI